MKHISTFVLRIEEVLAGAMLIAISALVFLSAIARTIGMPMIRIDMLEKRFPKPVRKTLALIFDVAMLLFLLILIVYGFLLVSQSWYRSFQTLKMSYAWCTLSVPVGALLLIFTIGSKFIKDIRTPMIEWGNN